MNLSTYLRDPVVIDESTNLDEACERIRVEDHTVVFMAQQDKLFPVKSFALLLAMQGPREEWSLEPLITGPPLRVVSLDELTAQALDVLADEVTLVSTDTGLKYILREDFLLTMVSAEPNSDVAWLRKLFSSIPRGLMIVDLNYAVVNSNKEALRMLRMTESDLGRIRMNDLLGSRFFQYVQNTHNALLNQVITAKNGQPALLVDFVPLVNNNSISGVALVLQDLPSVESMALELDSVRQLNQDLEAILSTIYDEIIVVDAEGKLLRASQHYIAAHWKQPPHELIGEEILKYNACGALVCQVIREVQSTRRKVSLMHNESEYPMVCAGNPIFTKKGKLERIVVASRDLTEVSRLQSELERTRKQSEDYRRELEGLRQRVTQRTGTVPIYVSTAMHEVMREAERVAQFSTTVLLTGESGVGKEIIANAIHSLSERRHQPFVKINCAAIPEALLESELFGYERGAFSGAKQDGKIGLFVKAHKGTLFLDEISDLPFGIQSKLLRAIQEREVYPVGGTTPVKFDVQIIAAANRSLVELVNKGEFRADLYYRINVFPIEVPPLRERKEDIAVLANHFLHQFNQRYQRNLRFSRSAIELLEAYEFPGNVRELQNVVQRMAIKNDGEVIDALVVENVLMNSQKTQRHSSHGRTPSPSRFEQVIPLKDAISQVEAELIALAMAKYGTTSRAAEALGISQSSVSRKYRNIAKQNR
ncbi:sigma 54-interacting transcriptional regulator [Alicyclobacillus pomorum]|uniref:sigma 54-interacting transcriptional regulator n=1 Tax=Alicyclobacillus pomorum TaxID=204470 RepID=UPI00041B6E0B|nr:sigma 54-interacting transcriptional regulator [Alicyclobacillus pomorum]